MTMLQQLNLTDSESELQETARRFVEHELIPLESRIFSNGPLNAQEITALKTRALELAICAPDNPKEFGGGGRTWTETCIINEELGKTLPYFGQICLFSPHENVVGETESGATLTAEWSNEARLLFSARFLGVSRRLLHASRRHSIRKKAQGKPIALRQSVQWKLADMAVEVHGLRLMLYHVAREMDLGATPEHGLLMLRYQASETATRTGDMTCDIFGAHGLMEDQPIAKMVEYARMSRHWPEPTEPLKFQIARCVFNSV